MITERKKQNIMTMSIATQSDPKELRKNLFPIVKAVKLDERGFEVFKSALNQKSQFNVK